MTESDFVLAGRADVARKPRLADSVFSRANATSRRLVMVSNRVTPTAAAKPDSGGLAVAIRAALQQSGGIWFGWSGEVRGTERTEPGIFADGQITFATVDLSQKDYDEYYIGYANRVLWPLFHYRSSLVQFSRRNLSGYSRVNRMFARALAPMLLPQDLVWVHDYHLIPLAEELRKLDRTEPIGFFLHTPFPAAELLRVLPNHQSLMRSLCSYDLVGFQTQSDLDGFRDYLLRWAGGEELGHGVVRAFGRVVGAQVFPIGIDVATVSAQAEAADGNRNMRRLRQSVGDRALMIASIGWTTPKASKRDFRPIRTSSRPIAICVAERCSCKSRRRRAPRSRNIAIYARLLRRRPARSTAATANSTGHRCAISTRASATRS